MAGVDLRSAAAELFREVFEGVVPGANGTWFVQGKEAIFDALSSVDAEAASFRADGRLSTLGAHAFHLNYYLSLFNANLRRENPEADWDGSWKKQTFTAEEWKALADDVRREYDSALEWYRNGPELEDQEQATYALANLCHAAYHLGAMRALITMVPQSRC